MTNISFEKDYYADRPTEPYSDNDSPNDWANIAHYAEENLERAFKRINELEKETRCECTRCVYSDSPCIRSDYGVEKDEAVCPNYKNVFVAYSQLKAENTELKEKLKPENCLKLLAKDGYIKFTSDELTKAKEIIKTFLGFAEAFGYSPSMDKFITEAEQFIKDSEE